MYMNYNEIDFKKISKTKNTRSTRNITYIIRILIRKKSVIIIPKKNTTQITHDNYIIKYKS